MAQHASAKKRIRRNGRRNELNRDRTSRIRSMVKKVETALTSGDKKVAAEAFKDAAPEIQRGVAKGVIHKNTAARKISRLSSRIKGLKA